MTNVKLAGILPALILSAIAINFAEAKPRRSTNIQVETFDRHALDGASRIQATILPAASHQDHPRHRGEQRRVASPDAQIVAHPSGCPARAFCGCGASVEVYGHPVRELWPARAWYRFPRTAAAPGMVAVRPHHVFVIREVLGGNMVLAYDANSGGRQTRIHPRSLAGYTVVNPRGGSRYARAD